jgi:uncharacterized protein YndB with AHSA1/START domain
MTTRVDIASRLISAPPERIYQAFAEPGALEKWIPPSDMAGEMLHFDFREGGSYCMRLTYNELPQDGGKTSVNSDEVEVRLIKLEKGKEIEQEVTFVSENPAFSGVMRMVWMFQPDDEGTLVTIRAENVPVGISPEDHEVGMNSSLENLAVFVEGHDR